MLNCQTSGTAGGGLRLLLRNPFIFQTGADHTRQLIPAPQGLTFQPFGPWIIFLILAHPVYKMWIIQEPNKLELWNRLHFEDKKTENTYHV